MTLAGPPGAAIRWPGYGNGGYDLRHYDLDVTYDPGTDVLDGRATVQARATQTLCSLNLDLVGLDVSSVKVNGRRADWSRNGQELTVTPRRPPKERHRFDVVVRYGGVPVEFEIPGFGIPAGFMTTPDGVTVAGQPEVAAAWFPVNDHPIDKASYTFAVTVPETYGVVANGFLVDRESDRGWTTWTWDAKEPMASYLATIDVGLWDVTTWRTADGLPVYDAVDSAISGGLRAEIDSSLARQGEVLDLLEQAFGPYPFSTVGAIVDNQDDLFFALETQTRPVYSKLFWLDPAGNPTYDNWPADDPFWTVVIGDPGVVDLFHEAIYFRGAMTVHTLRQQVGDDAFFAILQGWLADRGGGIGTTEEFIAYAEAVSGQQLDDLFQTWLYTPSRPELTAASAAASPAALAWVEEAQLRATG